MLVGYLARNVLTARILQEVSFWCILQDSSEKCIFAHLGVSIYVLTVDIIAVSGCAVVIALGTESGSSCREWTRGSSCRLWTSTLGSDLILVSWSCHKCCNKHRYLSGKLLLLSTRPTHDLNNISMLHDTIVN